MKLPNNYNSVGYRRFFSLFLVIFALFGNKFSLSAQHNEKVLSNDNETISEMVEDELHKVEHKYNAAEVIAAHISDAHDWHFLTLGHTHLTLPLPVIIYSKEKGLDMFMSNKFKAAEGTEAHGHNATLYHNGYVLYNGKIFIGESTQHIETDLKGAVTNLATVTDISITKNVASMFVGLLVLTLVFISVANAYKKTGSKIAPKGLQSFMEPLILFVRDDIAKPNLGNKADKFLPYLLTIFFFILINNILGLLPGAANVTGNIAVTFLLAFLTLIITAINGNKTYWGHIFNPPGVPKWLFPIMIPVELMGIFTKPFALMIRLFANITAGHIIMLSIIGLIFMFSNNGTEIGTGFGVSLGALPLAIFLYCLELLVVFIQAYIFTMLTALFIGQAVEDHHHPVEEASH